MLTPKLLHSVICALLFPILVQAQTDTLFISYEYNSYQNPASVYKIDWDQYQRVHVHAYSSGPGSSDYNLQLSKKRAEAFVSTIPNNLRSSVQIQYFGDANNPDDLDNENHRGIKVFATYKKEELKLTPKTIEKEEKPIVSKIQITVKDILTQESISNYTQNGNIFSAETYKDTSVTFPASGNYTVYLTPKHVKRFIRMENLLFYGDQAVLLPESERVLSDYLNSIQDDKDACFEIHGHVNAPSTVVIDKSEKELQKLSDDRAFAIYKRMLQMGFKKDNITFKGYSNTRMINPNARSEAEMRPNRRVEILMIECETKSRKDR